MGNCPEANRRANVRWWKRVGEVPAMWERQAIHRVRSRANHRGVPFALRPGDLLPLPEVCPLLGIKLDYSTGRGKGGFVPASPSVDRIDNKKGYVPGNVWIISNRANSIKRDADWDELRTIAMCLKTELALRAKKGMTI
jgi:hypothetical protein